MRFKLCIICLLLYNTANSQSALGFEQLYYFESSGPEPTPSAVVPRLYYQDRSGWYGEIRYNYDEVKTLSLYAGKTFSREDSLSWYVTPVAGLLLGQFKGGSVGANIAVSYGKWSFSSLGQYSFSVQDKEYNFIYSWSELCYQLTDFLFGGLVVQQTCLYQTNNKWDPGLQAGITWDKWSFPLYAFSPMSRDRHFVIGATWQWEWKGRASTGSMNKERVVTR